ncbi:hypothetical protein BJ875DRAFT_489804 [Amylocarpus encephaloides]|uniref:Zn(2)-C6 fungal-type domain-containing protein n=1 Tax=Amylocarpus encephaloides TaxID=45428 RepID=A0A9P7Y795_9HELO|nr:hypothetical protein BJ875DRAFT_489804 [Amylocarpus encephaloides]
MDKAENMEHLPKTVCSSTTSEEEEPHMKGKTRVKVKAPKVRTGCFTCRSRRVKCDEAKPDCKRCAKFGVECGGYQKDKLQRPKTRDIVPRTPTPRIILLAKQIHTGPRFADDLEARYFQHYVENIAVQIQGPIRNNIWDRLIPQAGVLQPYVRHGIVALGALTKSRQVAGLQEPDQSYPDYQIALIQYGKALKGMRESLSAEARNPRSALIACMLVFCFESLQGNQAIASLHASSLVSILCHWNWENDDTFYSVKVGGSRVCPDPANQIEDDLQEAFVGLDLQALLFIDSRPTATHHRVADKMSLAIDRMPANLESLDECQLHCQAMMRRNFHFVAFARAAIAELPSFTSNAQSSSLDGEVAIMRSENNPWDNPSTNESLYVPAHLLAERDRCVNDIWRWRTSSRIVLKRHCIPPPQSASTRIIQNFVQATILKIHAAFNIVFLARTFFPPETAYDAFIEEFRAVVDLSYSVVPYLMTSTGNTSMFRFDIGIIPALSQTAMLCRDSGIRGRAIDLLLSTPGYREGIWESLAMGTINSWIRDLEEEWMSGNGFVPGDRRASLSGVDIDMRKRTAEVTCFQKCGPLEDVEKNTLLTW